MTLTIFLLWHPPVRGRRQHRGFHSTITWRA